MKASVGDQAGRLTETSNCVSSDVESRYALEHGGRRAWLYNVWLGQRRRWGGDLWRGAVDFSGVRRLVFVCKGNICRSPYAAERACQWGLEATSVGLEAGGGPADPQAVAAARRRGIDLSRHCSGTLDALAERDGDLLIVMEPRQARLLIRNTGREPTSLSLLGLWCQPKRPHLQDPYGLSDAYFDRCFALIDSAVEGIALAWRRAQHEHAAGTF